MGSVELKKGGRKEGKKEKIREKGEKKEKVIDRVNAINFCHMVDAIDVTVDVMLPGRCD